MNFAKDMQPYIRRLAELERQRQGWDATNGDISDYLAPDRAMWVTRGQQPNDGKKRHSKVVDHTGWRSLRVLAAGMQSGLTSPSRPWFRLTLPDQDLAKYAPVKRYLHAVEQRMYMVFSTSNFYEATLNVYYDEGGYGQGLVSVEGSAETVIHCQVICPGEYSLARGARGMVNTVYRRFWMQLHQVVEEFGEEALSDQAKSRFKNNPDDWIQVCQAVQPRAVWNPSRLDNRNKPVESVYWEHGQRDRMLSESGFDNMPFMAPPWSRTSADAYGRGPGHETIGDIKMLQKQHSQRVQQTDMVGMPPMQSPPGYKHPVRLIPGASHPAASLGGDGLKPLYQVKPDLPAMAAGIADTREAIREGFFNDVFLMLVNHPDMTATEVLERKQEKLTILGPTIEKQITQLLDPGIERTYLILGERGLLPEPPREVQGQQLDIEYISTLAQVQKQRGTESLEATAAFTARMAEYDPQALDNFDTDKAITVYADLVSSDPEVIRPPEEVRKIRAARAEQQRKAQEQEQAMARAAQASQAATTAKTLAETPTGGENALAEVAAALEQSQPPMTEEDLAL